MVLVTGGTGLVGAHLLYALLQQYSKVRAIHRSTSDLKSVKNVFSYYVEDAEALFSNIEWVEADITDIARLDIAFEGVTHVYHCAAMITFNPKRYYTLKKTNKEGTANVVNLSLSHKVEKLCYVSSVATLGDSLDGSPVDEGNDWNPEADNNVYAITKFGAEMEVWRGMQEGLSVVIVNPGVILGEGYWHSGSGVIIKNAAKGTKYYPHGGSGFVDVKDVVSVMIQLMQSDISGERYVLVGQNLTYQEVLSSLATNFSKLPPNTSLSGKTLVWISKLDAVKSFLFRSKRKLLTSMAISLNTLTIYDSSKAEKELEFSFTPIEETIERVTKNYSSIS